jgi:DNA recombination protein RmuC
MLEIATLLSAVATLVAVVFLIAAKKLQQAPDITPRLDLLELLLRDDLQRARTEAAEQAKAQREELASQLARQSESGAQQSEMIRQTLAANLDKLARDSAERIDKVRQENDAAVKLVRAETEAALIRFEKVIKERLDELSLQQRQNLTNVNETLTKLVATFNEQAERIRASVDDRLIRLQQSNEERLEQMRKTVDEKLESTLQSRLGESFKLVSERLELVQKGLGEMQTLASGVGDLKKVLTNVRTRGTWGEVQLGNLLESMLAPSQFETNVPVAGTSERVEFAIRLPGRDSDETPVWLPIDSKFPKEDYERLVDAQERADIDLVAACGKALENAIIKNAQDISRKYIAPPQTTDFAIMFLPTEGLYAEVIRRPGLFERLQRDHKVNVSGPTTFAALLNSLQMGFRTLAIQKRSSEVWGVLGAVKTEFMKFSDVLSKVQRNLLQASKTIEDDVTRRTKAIERKLRSIQELPEAEARAILPATSEASEESDTEA